MEIDQTNYVQKVARIEIDKVQSKYGGQVIRMRIKGEDDDNSTLSFTLWGVFNGETLDHKPIELIVRDVDERVHEPELVEEEPDV